MAKRLIERRPKGSLPKWADGMSLHEGLNVPLGDLSSAEPADLELVRGMLTTGDLTKGHGRSLVHLWHGDYTGAACGRKAGTARQRTGDRREVTCILCLAWIRKDAAMCCRCSVEFICGCRCECHRSEVRP